MTALQPHRNDDTAPASTTPTATPIRPQTDTSAPASQTTPTTRAEPAARHRAPGHRLYLSVAVKFWLSVLFALSWTGVSAWISMPWVQDLTRLTGEPAAWIIVSLVAFLPGFVVAFLSLSLLLDRQPPFLVTDPVTPLTIIVAARNEQDGIRETIRCIGGSDYAGAVTVILADNGSNDATARFANVAAIESDVDLLVVREPVPGKSNALNSALTHVTTPFVITVDADTLLHREALRHLISRLESAPADTVAVAGAVLVRNSRINLLTRMQEWDYYLGIAAVKRMQGLYQSTLVAQGAFSVYRTEQVRAIGGWPDAIGEDIVVTWKLLEQGGRVLFEPTAVAFTEAPSTIRHFLRQRSRWARGMFEGLRAVPPWRQKSRLTGSISGIDYLIPLLDIGYGLIWVPGLVLFAVFGNTAVVSVWALAVLPITLLIYGSLRLFQSRRVFGPLGLEVRRNRIGYLAYLLGYQVLCSYASLVGYGQFLAGSARRWK